MGLTKKHTYVEALLQGPVPFRTRLDLHSWLQRLAFLTGEYEADTVRLLLRLHQSLATPGTLLDIGANIGMISLPAALALGRNTSSDTSIRVVSVEAIPDNAIALRHNIAMNNAQGLVSVIEKALGDQPGRMEIQVEGDLKPGEGTGTANILPAGSKLDPNGTYECVRIPIEITTLDALFASGEIPKSCKILKIDTDGYDLKILEGGRRFLQECRPVIFGEFAEHCLRWHGQSVRDVLTFAESLNYTVWQRVESSNAIKFHRRVDLESYSQDLLLVPCECEELLEWCCK